LVRGVLRARTLDFYTALADLISGVQIFFYSPISINLSPSPSNSGRLCVFLIETEANGDLKVPKRENFSLAFFALSEPTWVCDLGSGKKGEFFIK
jgi:hypothetical protein